MKTFSILFSFAALLFLNSCNPKVSSSITKSYPPLDYTKNVLVIELDESVPENAEVIGQVKIGDTGFSTNCDYPVVLDRAKLEAKKAGGNAIKIIKHTPPSVLTSSCHRITADILRIDDIESYTPIKQVDSSLINADYAIIKVYRNSGIGALINYDLYLGDSVICRVQNRWRKSIKIKKDGYNSLWAKTETKTELPIKIERGHVYYVRCGITMGVLVGRPSLELIENSIGEAEYNAVRMRGKEHDLIVLKTGRELECIITGEDENTVFLKLLKDGKEIDTYIDKDEIESIQKAEK